MTLTIGGYTRCIRALFSSFFYFIFFIFKSSSGLLLVFQMKDRSRMIGEIALLLLETLYRSKVGTPPGFESSSSMPKGTLRSDSEGSEGSKVNIGDSIGRSTREPETHAQPTAAEEGQAQTDPSLRGHLGAGELETVSEAPHFPVLPDGVRAEGVGGTVPPVHGPQAQSVLNSYVCSNTELTKVTKITLGQDRY